MKLSLWRQLLLVPPLPSFLVRMSWTLSLRGFSVVSEQQEAEPAWGLWDRAEAVQGRKEAKSWAWDKPYFIQRRGSGKRCVHVARCGPCGRGSWQVPLKSCHRRCLGGERTSTETNPMDRWTSEALENRTGKGKRASLHHRTRVRGSWTGPGTGLLPLEPSPHSTALLVPERG